MTPYNPDSYHYIDFDIPIPEVLPSQGVATVTIKVPAVYDDEIKEYILTQDAHDLIDTRKMQEMLKRLTSAVQGLCKAHTPCAEGVWEWFDKDTQPKLVTVHDCGTPGSPYLRVYYRGWYYDVAPSIDNPQSYGDCWGFGSGGCWGRWVGRLDSFPVTKIYGYTDKA